MLWPKGVEIGDQMAHFAITVDEVANLHEFAGGFLQLGGFGGELSFGIVPWRGDGAGGYGRDGTGQFKSGKKVGPLRGSTLLRSRLKAAYCCSIKSTFPALTASIGTAGARLVAPPELLISTTFLQRTRQPRL